jgi:glycosyltransferase involved in cell wall biosynthesis
VTTSTRTNGRARIVANVRTLRAYATGVQRYTIEVVERLADEVDSIAPSHAAHGILGHVWEQTALPAQLGDRLLWSPGGTGPWRVSHQVVTIHDAAPLDHAGWFDRKFARWYGFLLPRLLANVRSVITVSEFSRRRLAAHVPAAEDRIAVIPLGIGAAFRPASDEEVAAVRQRLRLPPAYSYVLSVGSLQPRKNVARLLEAWSHVRDRVPDTILAVAGVRFDEIFGGAGFERLPRRVLLLGYVDEADLAALYTGARAFAYPSLYEGFGLPPLEAMACGTPVLAADAGSLPEVSGDAAVLVEPRDVDAIGDGLVRVLEDEALRARLRERGFDRAKEYSWDRTAAETGRVLRSALE